MLSGPTLSEPVEIDTTYTISWGWGWIAPLLNLIQNRSSSFPYDREVEMLRSALVRHLDFVEQQSSCEHSEEPTSG